jgi:CRISPR-associated protein Cmr2
VLYAHVKTALGEVLRQAHSVLDDEAKDGAGRDAIAIRVLKPGGDHLTWAQPWEIALDGSKLKLENLATEFAQANDSEGQFSSKFFYRIRERFTLLQDGLDKDQIMQDGLNKDQQIALLAADYIASDPAKRRDPVTGKPVKISMEEAKQVISPLLTQCRQHVRDINVEQSKWETNVAKADAALVVRFLANKGVEVR